MQVLGLMSGTSADGVDAVLVDFHGSPKSPKWRLLNFVSIGYPLCLRKAVVLAGQNKKFTANEWIDLAETITEIHAEAARNCDPAQRAEIVSCHGQTIWHRPPSNTKRGASMQLLQAPLLAKLVKRPVIHDFRSADLALGGQGAPLVPLLDQALLGRIPGWRAILNLGGIANLTLIPPNSGPDRFRDILGWDCGPANTLLDLAVQKFTQNKKSYDCDGLMASTGTANKSIIKDWLNESFFTKCPPKSTGRDEFGIIDLERRIEDLGMSSKEDIMATLTCFTAAIIGKELDNLFLNKLLRPIELIVAGGGSLNPVMLNEIRKQSRGLIVQTIDKYGVPNLAREALAFALLGWWHIHHFPGNSPFTTGASKSTVLGVKVNP